MYPSSIFYDPKNRSSGSTKKLAPRKQLEKLDTINELSLMEELDIKIKQEKRRLFTSGARTLSDEYQALVQRRQQLNSSPRSVGTLPYSPTKSVCENMNEHRRSPMEMRRGLLQKSPKAESDAIILPLGRSTKPVLMASEPELKTYDSSDKVAYGLSALRVSYLQPGRGSNVDVASSVDSSHSSVLASSMESSVFSQSASSSFSDGEFSFSSAFGSSK